MKKKPSRKAKLIKEIELLLVSQIYGGDMDYNYGRSRIKTGDVVWVYHTRDSRLVLVRFGNYLLLKKIWK